MHHRLKVTMGDRLQQMFGVARCLVRLQSPPGADGIEEAALVTLRRHYERLCCHLETQQRGEVRMLAQPLHDADLIS